MTEAATDMPDARMCALDGEIEFKNTQARAHAHTPVHQQKHLEAVCSCSIFTLVS